jgi:hypothetical protein
VLIGTDWLDSILKVMPSMESMRNNDRVDEGGTAEIGEVT